MAARLFCLCFYLKKTRHRGQKMQLRHKYSKAEEDEHLEIIQRKRRRGNYIVKEEEEGKEVEEEKHDEQDDDLPGPSKSHNRTDTQNKENGLWMVTCGNKTGVMDVAKLARAEECIESGGRWFAPCAFEEFGGKGTTKKWKSSIFHENKPLYFWFRQGYLTTSRFKKRTTPNLKEETNMSVDSLSETSSDVSETPVAEASDEDVKDEDWLPGNEELMLETEEESTGAAADSGLDTSKEEEDKEGEMKAVDMSDDDGNDVCALEKQETNRVMMEQKKLLQREIKVVIRKLPEDKDILLTGLLISKGMSDCRSKHTEDQKRDSWCKPLDYSEDEEQYNSSQLNFSSAAAATHVSPSLISVQPISGGEELSQSNETGDGVQEEIKAESDGGVVRSDPVLQIAVTTSAAGVKDGQAANKSQSVIVKYENSNPNIRWNNEVELSQMSLETRVPQTVPDSDIIDFSDAPQALPSQPSSSCDLDIMDLDQLKKEKLKMQIKVLRLQEEYYAQKLKELLK